MTLFVIILRINYIDIIWQTIYGSYRKGNFYLIKINKPPPEKYNNVKIMRSISFENFDYVSINWLQNNPKLAITLNINKSLYSSFITTLIFYLNYKLSSYNNFPW